MSRVRSQTEHHLYDIDFENLGNPEHIREYEWAASNCKGLKVLDFGCNTGLGSWILAKGEAKEVVGVDVSSAAIDLANDKFKDNEAMSFKLVGDDLAVIENDSMDAVVALNIIEHLENPKFYLKEMKRILKPEGKLILSTVNRHFRIFSWQKPWNEFHYREYNKASLETELKSFFPSVEMSGLVDPEGPYHPYNGKAVFQRKFRIGVYYPVLNSARKNLGFIKKALGKKSPVEVDANHVPASKIVNKGIKYSDYKDRVLIENKNVNHLPKLLAIAVKK